LLLEGLMDAMGRLDRALSSALAMAEGADAPPRLIAAMRHAVFPGGARVRPKLSLAVAGACGDDNPALSDAAAVAIELLHCASLVHDDLPCFDNAALRRGKPSVHQAFGERLAVLAGDALIVLAFQTLARGAPRSPARLPALLATVAGSVGAPSGIAAGQAWECEPRVSLSQYQRAKTGSLFVASTVAGAQAAGADARPWRELGERLGEAYQVADDIRDVLADAQMLGKPPGRDAELGRPSAAIELGLTGAIEYFDALIAGAIGAVPEGPSAGQFSLLIQLEAQRLLPKELVSLAAA
jgi:geranylgeranyl diphosphate synthase, type II